MHVFVRITVDTEPETETVPQARLRPSLFPAHLNLTQIVQLLLGVTGLPDGHATGLASQSQIVCMHAVC